MQIKVEYVPIESIRPYENNAKIHTAEQVEQIKKSIQDYGMNDPIGIWGNTIVEGHGRFMALVELGYTEIPVIRLDHMTDEQRREYMLVHNQTTMNTGFDFDLLDLEIEDLQDFDAEFYGLDFELPLDAEPDDRDPSCQHNVFENQERMQFGETNYYGIPNMKATKTKGDKFLRFMDYNNVEDHSEYIAHFYYDDYKFIEAWRDPDKYIAKLQEFKAVVAPDFSLYTDFPRALQILSCYRRQWVAAYWQARGLDVIPDVVWGDEESFNYCFLGIPEHSTVAVSSVGVKNDSDWNGKDADMFKRGYDEMLERLKPKTILFYGDMIDGLDGNIINIPSYYAEKRDYLNKKAEEKKANG